jgi:hypothetical protein
LAAEPLGGGGEAGGGSTSSLSSLSSANQTADAAAVRKPTLQPLAPVQQQARQGAAGAGDAAATAGHPARTPPPRGLLAPKPEDEPYLQRLGAGTAGTTPAAAATAVKTKNQKAKKLTPVQRIRNVLSRGRARAPAIVPQAQRAPVPGGSGRGDPSVLKLGAVKQASKQARSFRNLGGLLSRTSPVNMGPLPRL